MRNLVAAVEAIDPLVVTGKVAGVSGLLIESRGGLSRLAVGARAEIGRRGHAPLPAEVVGFRDSKALLMPFGPVEGVAPGADIRIIDQAASVRPSTAWLGRIIDAFGHPIDGKGPLPQGPAPYPLRAPPPPAHSRGRVGERLDLGVRAMDVFTTTCRGQRLGIFAGSGVGKSVLLSMLAKQATCDAVVVGLIGERGREVREFVEETLGEEGLKRAVVVVATSDEPALKRRQSAYMTMAVAEYLRDQDLEVLCLMDSVTRFAMAQREIGLAVGEPPTFRGYTPSVFSWLPRIAERCGRHGAGSITAIYSVLVEGDDLNEPITDHMRAILDGHVVLTREHAARGQYPAIDVLKSTSRLVSALAKPEELALAAQVRRTLALYEGSRDMIELGAHQPGVNAALDRAIEAHPRLNDVLAQHAGTAISRAEALAQLSHVLEQAGIHERS